MATTVESRSPMTPMLSSPALCTFGKPSAYNPLTKKNPAEDKLHGQSGEKQKNILEPDSVAISANVEPRSLSNDTSQSRNMKRKTPVKKLKGKENTEQPIKKTVKEPSKKSKKENSDMPKRPSTAFIHFMAAFRDEFKKTNPDSKNATAVSKAGGAKWKEMSAEEKNPFVKKAAEEKAAYEHKLQEYNKRTGTSKNVEKNAESSDGKPESNCSSTNDSGCATCFAEEVVADNIFA